MDPLRTDNLDPDGVYSFTRTGDQWREYRDAIGREASLLTVDLIRRMAVAGGYTESQRAAILDVANQFETGVTGCR